MFNIYLSFSLYNTVLHRIKSGYSEMVDKAYHTQKKLIISIVFSVLSFYHQVQTFLRLYREKSLLNTLDASQVSLLYRDN